MRKYKIEITFTQTVIRYGEFDNEDEAEDFGFDIAESLAELKAINVDVLATPH